MTKHRIFWLMVAATWLAALVRWAGWLSLPPQAWQDELWFALRAREILHTGEWPLFYKTFWGGVNPLLVWLTAGAQALGFVDVPVVSRWVSTTFGILSVPLFYAACRELAHIPAHRPPFAAYLPPVILTTFFYTLTLSRIGTEPAVALAASLFCVWQQRRATRLNAPLSFVLAGAGAGLAQYISPHARFIPIVMLLWGLHDLWREPRWRVRLTHYALLALAFIVTFGPLLAFFLNEPEWFWGRARAVTTGTQTGVAPFLFNNLWAVTVGLSFIGDANARDNAALRPLLDALQSFGFYVGVGAMMLALRRSTVARYLVMWLGVMLVPVLITDNAPSFSRMMLAAPPIAVLIAWGWQWWVDLVGGRWPAQRQAVVLVIVVASSGLWNTADYFLRYVRQPQLPQVFTTQAVNTARELVRRSTTATVFAQQIEGVEDYYAFDFFFPNTKIQRLDFRQCLPVVDGRATSTLYLVQSQRDRLTVPELTRQYPPAQTQVFMGEPEALYREFTLVEVPPYTSFPPTPLVAQAQFMPGLRLLGYEQSTTAARAGESVFFAFYWKAEALINQDATAFLHIGERQVLQRDGQPCQGFYPTSRWQIGDVVPDRFALTILPETPPGTYPIVIGWYVGNQRLTLATADQPLADDRAIIGTLTILAP